MLNEKLRELRKGLGYTVQHTGDSIFKSRGAYYAYERGNTSPSPDTLKRLCVLFNITPNELLEWDER